MFRPAAVRLASGLLVAAAFIVYAMHGQAWIERHLEPFATGATVLGGIVFAFGLTVYACNPGERR